MFEKQNKVISAKVSSEGRININDKTTGAVWECDNTGWISFIQNEKVTKINLGCPIIEENDDEILMTFINEGDYPFVVEASIKVTQENIEINLLKVQTDCAFDSVEYPAHLLSFPSGESESYLAVPYKQGTIIPGRLDAGFMRFMHNTWANISDIDKTIAFESCTLNMTWFGAQSHESGMFGYMLTPEDSSLHVIGNAVIGESGEVVNARQGLIPGHRICSLTPVWRSSCGELRYTRSMRIETVKDGYVGMTKRYREYVKENGRFVSLKEKIQKNPEIEKLIGAPDIKIYIYTNRPNTPYYRSWSEPVLNGYTRVHTTFDQVGEMAEQLKKLGVDQALILLGGWNRAGYDRQHIDMWPPAESAGGEEGLARAGRKVLDQGYIFSLHDNYQDIYLESPSYDEKYVMKHPDGSIKLGGIWDGGLCRLVCSKTAMQLIKHTIEQVEEKVNISSYYLDTITSAPLYECYDKEHPLTRKEDKEMKIEILDYLANEKGLIAGGEAGIDWAVAISPFFEGLPGSSVGYSSGVESAGFGIATPLFNLVYHDAVVCYWQHGQPFGREDHDNHVLHDLLSGQPSSWSLVYDQWEDLLPMIKQCYDLLGNVHKKTAHSEMLSHHFLTEDFAVQESAFEDGTKVIVNYGITTYRDCGYEIPPKGFWLSVPGDKEQVGSFSKLAQFKS